MRVSYNIHENRNMTREEEHITERALEQILSSPDLDAAASTGENVRRDLHAYLQSLIHEKGIAQADAIRQSGLDYNHAYDVLNGRRNKGVTRDKALGLCFGLRCTPREAQRLLWHAKCSRLYSRNRRDAIIIWCLEHGQTLAETDEALYEFGEATIGDAR